MPNNGYRNFKEGPIHLVYAGGEHVGNVIEPTFGGSDSKTQKFTAISRVWGRKTTHDSKHSAMQWLQDRHGSNMKIESTGMDIGSTHDVLRDNEWKKPTPYGFANHLKAHERPTYVHRQFPGHRITASYTNDTWQHYKSAKDSTPHVGMGAASLHKHLNQVHSSHTIDAVKEYVAYVKLNNPDNWQEILIETQHSLNEHEDYHEKLKQHGWLLRHRSSHEDVYMNGAPEYRRHKITVNHSMHGLWHHDADNKNLNGGKTHAELVAHITKFHSKNEELQQEEKIQGPTPRSKMIRSIKHERVKIVKKNPSLAIQGPKSKLTIGEELEDLEKNQKDPKAQPQKLTKPKPEKVDSSAKENPNDDKQGPKPAVSVDAEGELTIKRTMTGEAGDTIQINPMMQRFPNSMGGTTAYKQIQAPEHKKSVV